MKPIVIDEAKEKEILLNFAGKFRKALDEFKEKMNDTKLSFSVDFTEVAKEKVTILFTQQAYLRMQALVEYFSTEVAWYGLVEKISDKLYRVYDVKVCKQYVDGGKVDTEDDDTLEFFNSLTDDEAEHMHFQAHSHVKMSTNASGVDLQNQTDVVHSMGKSGFYIFQIWNKDGDINTYLYDLDNNVFYDRKDVVIEIEDQDKTISDWLCDIDELVVEKKAVYPYVKEQKTKKGKKNEEPEYTPYYYHEGYWNGNNYYGGYDW